MTAWVMQWNRHISVLPLTLSGAAVPWTECYLLIGR
ncbi:protein of unknown function (plasmid) [Cupriavidus taiwanensis]|nr:protein of unknown function [Cupriavidus taiwanensis]